LFRLVARDGDGSEPNSKVCDIAQTGWGWLRHNATMGLTSFYHHKAERCAQLAKDEVDPRRSFQLETEGKLWLQIAAAEENLDDLRKKAKDHLNGQPLHVPGTGLR
jgi:hypothetical protein